MALAEGREWHATLESLRRGGVPIAPQGVCGVVGKGASRPREAASLDWALWLLVCSVGPSRQREMKSMACRRGRESSSSSSHEVFWISRLMPPHLTSLSVVREWGRQAGWEWRGAGPRARVLSPGEAGAIVSWLQPGPAWLNQPSFPFAGS